jgi:hypothetical protein
MRVKRKIKIKKRSKSKSKSKSKVLRLRSKIPNPVAGSFVLVIPARIPREK